MATTKVIFAGYDAKGGLDLWVTNGTAAGTSELTISGTYSYGLLYSGNADFTLLAGQALFAGYDANGQENLWVTDGTVAGTGELTVPGQDAYGLQPRDFTLFGGAALFAGYDASGHYNLWVTNGTAAGTSELTAAGASSSGLIYYYNGPDVTVLGNKALFQGEDTSGHLGLWVTNGTVAGTSEVQVATASSSGLLYSGAPDFLVLGGKALFAGYDASGHRGLWTTNGTTSGTSELTSTSAYSAGLFYYTVVPNLTRLNASMAVFEGDDAIGHYNLWVTNGTSAGTSELTAKGADPSGLFYFDAHAAAPDFTPFGTKMLFNGEDSSSAIGLWISDGTSAGTSEITASGADSTGLFSNGTVQVAPDLTVLGAKALFAGFDNNGHAGLWVTNGTAAGTSELVVAGSDPSGLFYNNGPVLNPDFTVVGSTALFEGFDVNGHQNLWVTNGTSAGTSELPVAGADSTGLAPTEFIVIPPPPSAPTGLALAAGSDSGVKGDGVTNVTKPTITGAGQTGDTVILYNGSTAIGSAVVGAGTWSVTPSGVLSTGLHTLTATETNPTSGTSAASAPLKLTIKTAAPVPSGLSFAVAADKGSSGDTFAVAGRGEAGDTVTLYDGATAIGSATAAAGGTWSITTANPLAAGAHSLTAKEVDVAGNTSLVSAAQSLTIRSATPNAVVFVGTPGTDRFTGGAGNDIFEFSSANLANTDTAAGGGGSDELLMTTPGTVLAGGVRGVASYVLANGGANSLTLVNANFGGLASGAIWIYGGNAGNTVNAAAVTGANRIVAIGGAGADTLSGGAGNDTFEFSAATLANTDKVTGGGGTNYLDMTSSGTVAAGGISGVEVYELAGTGANSLTLANANFAGVTGASIRVTGGSAGNTVNAAALTGANRIVAVGGAGTDRFTGGAGNDIFEFSAANLAGSDTVAGGGGSNELVMTTAGTVLAGGVSGVGSYVLANGGANSLTLANANFGGLGGAAIWVYGGNSGNTVNAAALTGSNRIVAFGGAGADTLTGGAGNDTFEFAAANLASTDKVSGGGGTNFLQMTSSGTVLAGGVSGVEVYDLASTGANSLTLANANFAGVSGGSIRVNGGNAGNRVDAAALTGANHVVAVGGAGADTFIVGRNATLTGGGGADLFEFTTPGSTAAPTADTITDFTAGTDRIAFSNAGFSLGLAGASATPHALPTSLFSTQTNGVFDNSAERLAYNAATGALYYDAQGNTAGSSRELVGTLTNHPTLAATGLFFVS